MDNKKPPMESPYAKDPLEYNIEVLEDGTRIASNPINNLHVLPDGETRIFKRRIIKKAGSSNPEFRTILVGELDGVRVYVRGNDIVLSKRDLYE